ASIKKTRAARVRARQRSAALTLSAGVTPALVKAVVAQPQRQQDKRPDDRFLRAADHPLRRIDQAACFSALIAGVACEGDGKAELARLGQQRARNVGAEMSIDDEQSLVERAYELNHAHLVRRRIVAELILGKREEVMPLRGH